MMMMMMKMIRNNINLIAATEATVYSAANTYEQNKYDISISE